jgi:hypothetical protein
MADETDEGLDLEAQFEVWYQERTKRDEDQKNRSKQPKDFAEFLDRVADAVWERGEARAAKRRQDADDADQAPARGAAESKLAQWWNGGKAEAS